jgi:uncharacterized SAM-binding protein YcdF (DUF218 family)
VKLLVNPLVWFLLFQLVAVWLLLTRGVPCGRGLLRVQLLLTLLLGALATPYVRQGLEASLQVGESAQGALLPAYVFVLGGGYLTGTNPDEDLLIVESQRRALHGIAVWHRYPAARLVFSGASREYADLRDDTRHAQLMAEVAHSRGVPATSIVLEPRSGNTHEHRVEALKLPGVTPSTPIGVVTSGWHMRRAQREFCRHFREVAVYRVPAVPRPMIWQDFVPNPVALDAKTTLMREWVGGLWYEILDRINGPRTGELSCAA